MRFSYIVIFVIVLILGLAGYIVFIRPKIESSAPKAQSPNTQQATKIIPVNPASIPPGDKITFGTAHGTVSVNNFFKAAAGYDGDVLVIRKTAQYEILYDSTDSAFGIYITSAPVSPSRVSAEDDIVNILGIPRSQVCYLDAGWSVSAAIDKNLSGRNYPLGFCSSAVHGVQ